MEWQVPFLDLRLSGIEKQRMLEVMARVMDHGKFILGPEVEEFERRIADYCGRQYAVGVNSGTDALFIALHGLGVKQGDEVIVPALSWIATANAVAMTGARPVFADILDDLTIDPDSVRSLITENTKAIIPVHYSGVICDMPTLSRIATEYGIPVLEDAAQAFGSSLDGNKAGSFGYSAAFSMNPVKTLGALGEAGVIVTDDAELYEKMRSFRYNGMVDRVACVEPGLNARLDALQAAVLVDRMDSVDRVISRRRDVAAQYTQALSEFVEVPVERAGCQSVNYTYNIKTEDRDTLLAYIRANGVEAMVRDPVLMPDQQAYVESAVSYPNAKAVVDQLLALPIHAKMTNSDVAYVIEKIIAFYKESEAGGGES